MTGHRGRNGKKAQAAWSGCGTCGVAFKWCAAASVAAGNDDQGKGKQVLTTQNKFYCNSKALDPAERVRHKQLTDKLIAGRKEIVKAKKGLRISVQSIECLSRGAGRLG